MSEISFEKFKSSQMDQPELRLGHLLNSSEKLYCAVDGATQKLSKVRE